MQKEGIGIGISYEAIHLSSYFRAKGFAEGRFPVSERIARETVTLPLHPEMRETDVHKRDKVRLVVMGHTHVAHLEDFTKAKEPVLTDSDDQLEVIGARVIELMDEEELVSSND